MNEGVGFGFVIIELLVRYSPPRRVFLFGLRIDDGNDASKPKHIVVSTFSGKFLTTNGAAFARGYSESVREQAAWQARIDTNVRCSRNQSFNRGLTRIMRMSKTKVRAFSPLLLLLLLIFLSEPRMARMMRTTSLSPAVTGLTAWLTKRE